MGEEEEQKEKPVQERLCKVGKVIVGRLNIHHPEDGSPTKYYINWCNRAFDNLLMTHEEMRKVFNGNLTPLKVGMYFEIMVSHVPENPKVHPTGINARPVPPPAHKRKRWQRK